MRALGSSARIFLLLCLAAAAAWAQSTAQINGTVTDATGAAVPGADVKATQTATGVARTVTSGAAGEFVLSNLDPGPYSLEVSKQGFSRFVQNGINLAVADNPNIPVSLNVGNVISRSKFRPMRPWSKPRMPVSARSWRTSGFWICPSTAAIRPI